MTASKIIIALDYPNPSAALAMAEQLNPQLGKLKVGNELFTAAGPELINTLQKKGFDVFLDLKYHDIPNTVANAVKAAASLGVWMVNLHISGGPRMLNAAANALSAYNTPPLLIGVTALTSFTEQEWQQTGQTRTLHESIDYMTNLAIENGLDGVVCSAHEVQRVKTISKEQLLTVTPGIRLMGDNHDDQVRIMTPQDALSAGSDFLVMGRSVTQKAEHANTILMKLAQL